MYEPVLREETYQKTMDETVVPYLETRKKVFYLKRGFDMKLYCARYLADDAEAVVILSHGFTETEEKYKETIYYFVKNHYHVYMHDHCGHGRSYRLVDDLSLVHVDAYGRYVQDLLAVTRLARKEHPELPLYLYGHSMGGGVAAAVLAMEPEVFSKAILSSPMIRPLTKGIPWAASTALALTLCGMGKSEDYVPGGQPFVPNQETFEASPSMNRQRYDYYQAKRESEPLFQMTSPSCGWVNGAAKLNRYLQATAWKQIRTPFLLFQAEHDTFVVNKEQDRFVRKVNQAGLTTATLVKVPETKHEIFNSSTSVLEFYWKTILDFLKGTDDAG